MTDSASSAPRALGLRTCLPRSRRAALIESPVSCPLFRSQWNSVYEALLGPSRSGSGQISHSTCPSPSCPIRAVSRLPRCVAHQHPTSIDSAEPADLTVPGPVRFVQCADTPGVVDALRGITSCCDDQNLLKRLPGWDSANIGTLVSCLRRVRITDNGACSK
jgi:hypothetical protein